MPHPSVPQSYRELEGRTALWEEKRKFEIIFIPDVEVHGDQNQEMAATIKGDL